MTSYTPADLANIEQLIASGVQTTTFQGVTMTYGNLLKLRAHIAAQLDNASAAPTSRVTLTERGCEGGNYGRRDW